jgi:hypothetical protein
MTANRTRLLMLLAIVAAATALTSYLRLSKLRDDALAAREDLIACNGYLAEMGHTTATGGSSGNADEAGNPEINRRIREAATAASVAEPSSIEPSVPRPVPNSDFSEVYVSLRFDSLTMRDLISFLHRLRATDPSSRAKTIELAPPEGTPTGVDREPIAEGGEQWGADVGITYLLRAARDPGRR